MNVRPTPVLHAGGFLSQRLADDIQKGQDLPGVTPV